MIQARVTLNTWDEKLDHREIEAWLIQNVGQRAQESDQVDESRPWGARYAFGIDMVYYFARESDATLFKLRWA